MTNKKKSSIDKVIEQIRVKVLAIPSNTKENRAIKGAYVDCIVMLQQAKEMHKQEHEDTFNESRLTHPIIGFKHDTFEDYYSQTFDVT